MATLCKVFLAAIIFLMFFYSTTLAMNLSLRFGCGTRGVLSENDRSDSRRNGFVSNTRREVAAKLKG